MIKLLVTDLDDTLYPWIEFFVPAFYAMAEEVSRIIEVPLPQLLDDYRKTHIELKSVEYPYATLRLDSVKRAFPDLSKDEVIQKLEPAFHAFNSVRKKRLKLFPTVEETLHSLLASGIRIVGYTESAEENGYYRLKRLSVDTLFETIYVSDSSFEPNEYLPKSNKTVTVCGKKPNSKLLHQILMDKGVTPEQAIYVGDSITKDVYMAVNAGVTSVLYRNHGESDLLYQKLVAISSWTQEDFQLESLIRKECVEKAIRPDYTIDRFSELVSIIESLNRN